MAGPQERYGQQPHAATEIAADDAGVSAAAERVEHSGAMSPCQMGIELWRPWLAGTTGSSVRR